MEREDFMLFIGFQFVHSLFEIILWDWEDDENEANILCPHLKRNRLLRIENYVERIIPNLQGTQFQMHFRITRTTYEILIPKVGVELNKIYDEEYRTRGIIKNVSGRKRIDAEKQLLAVIWLLATPDSYRSVGERFNLGKSSLSACFFRVVKAITSFAHTIIRWPNLEEMNVNRRKFFEKAGLDGVIGAIDGTYIPIKAPKENPQVYITRKCQYAFTLQAICNADLKFIDCYIGYPGSVSDVRIFKNSDIYQDISENRQQFFPNADYFIIGDKAYPVLPWCIPPYINRGQLTRAHKNFNFRHSKTRASIERSFALLFGRFRRLKFIDMNCIDKIPADVLACCVIHNVCLDSTDLMIQEFIVEGRVNVGGNDEVELIHQRNEERDGRAGFRKRDELCQDLFNA